MDNTNGNEAKFEHWCLVELMGHQRIAGKVTEVNLFGSALMRVDVPEIGNKPGYTKFYGANAIYAVTPIEEPLARVLAGQFDVRPVEAWQLRGLLPEPEPANQSEINALRQTLHNVQRLATDAQGEWLPIDASQSPEWTLPLKEIACDIEDVLSQEEFTDNESVEDLGF